MSDEKPKKPTKVPLSRRGFFRSAGGAVAATTLSGGATNAVAAAAQKVSTAGTAAIIAKIAQSGGFPAGAISDLIRASQIKSSDGEASVDPFEAMRQRLMGGGDFQRNQKRRVRGDFDVQWNEKYVGKINIRAEENALHALKNLPKDTPLSELLSEQTLGTLYGGKGDFDNNENVKVARELRKLVGPLCDETTTAPEIIDRFMGFFRKCAAHAVEKPQDFEFYEHIGNSSKWDCKDWSGHTTQDKILSILRDNTRHPEADDSLLERLEKTNEAWKSERLEAAWQERSECAKAQKIAEKAKQAEERARKQAKRLEASLEAAERKRIQLENPEKRSARVIILKYLEGDDYFVDTTPDDNMVDCLPVPTQEHWVQWLQIFNPEATGEHVSVKSNGKIVNIPKIPENDRALQALWRTGTEYGRFQVQLPNKCEGVDLNQRHEEYRDTVSLPYGPTDASINLNIEISSISASAIIVAHANPEGEKPSEESNAALSRFFGRASERNIDELTGLLTPSGMIPEIEKQLKYRGNYYDSHKDDNLIAAHIDITHFKEINNQFGHEIGDVVLQELAQRINTAFKHSAVIGRVAGDEMLLLFHRNGEKEDNVDKAIRDALDGKPPLPFSQGDSFKQLGVNVSVAGAASRQTAPIMELRSQPQTMHGLPFHRSFTA